MRDISSLTDLSDKRILVRIDTDVEVIQGRVEDDYRLRAAIPTIRALRQAGATITLIGHRGRPKGRQNSSLSLAPVARRLAALLVPGSLPRVHRRARYESPIFATTYTVAKNVELLENLRFDAGEEDNESEFVQLLIQDHDLFVNESFATAHRAAASTVGVAKRLPSYAGLRLVDEVAHLSLLLHGSERPTALVVGGAKMEEKLGLLEHLLSRVDYVLTGGVAANMLLKAKGVDIQRSLIEPKLMAQAERLLEHPQAAKIILPTDLVWGRGMILDIGPITIAHYQQIVKACNTVFWAGSLGKAEDADYAKGTNQLARTLAEHKGMRMVGGGDTSAALQRARLLNKMSFVSTGGGAALEFLAGKSLPALKALE